MIQDEMKNQFLILSPSQSYDGSIMMNKNEQESYFQVGKRIGMLHPRQPSYYVEEDKTPAFEIFDLKAHKQNKGITWQFRNQKQQTILKNNITEVNTFKKNQKKVLLFIEKLKQNLNLENKQYKIINSIIFSPLNTGKKIYKNSVQPSLTVIWNLIIFFFCTLLLIVSPIEYIYQENGYLNYLFATMIILIILDYIHKYTSQRQQEKQLNNNQQFIEQIFRSTTTLMDTSCIILLAVLILSNNEIIKSISLLIIKFLIFKKIILTFNKRIYYELSDLSLLIISILFTCHFFTCINLRQTFILKQDFEGVQDMLYQYLIIYINYILQFGNLKFSTEDDTLQNQLFNRFTTLILLFYKILIIKLIILNSLDFFQEYKKVKDLKLLQNFLHKQKVSQKLKDQISLKLEQIFLKNISQDNIENYFESCLEKETVFQEFKEQKLINFVNQFSIFSKFSSSTKQQIAQNLIPMILNKNDKLTCNQFGDQYNIYLLYQGKVAHGLTEKITEFNKIFRGECFGQFSFFTGQEYKNLITSLDYSLLYKLSRDKFLKIISSNIQDLEIATFIKDQVLFNNNYQIIDQFCLYCQEKTHLIINCPKIHLIKNNIGFYDKYLYSPNQHRKSYNRRKKSSQDQIQNHFKKLVDIPINHYSSQESSSELNQLSSSIIESNLVQKEGKFQVDSCINLLNEINNDNLIQSSQKDQQYQEIISSGQSQQQQQKLQSKNVFDQKISNLFNRAYSLKLIPSLQSNPSPIVKIQTPSLPTGTEFQNLVSDNPFMENIFKIDLDRIQDFEIYYPEYNIMKVLFRFKRSLRRSSEYKSKLTINQSVALMIGKFIQKRDQLSKI
ncbi:unnamed protein product [Paramecium sonneborni]|uniref:Cyclic nucleotide-binding domain-containing protein n=1 Tax=Paramecium sonneborni TaxID=65129 RepID=A0A8S1MJN7_9CILI|nr:unnamed protein product [Paramecium sonneborni]